MRAQLERRHHPAMAAIRGVYDRWRDAYHVKAQQADAQAADLGDDTTAPAVGRGLRFTRGEIREFLLAYCACFVAAMAFLA